MMTKWIAQLLQHGLLKASFVPPVQQREWRDLTRQRVQLVAQATQVANHYERLQPARLTRHLVKRLEALGNRVILQPAAA